MLVAIAGVILAVQNQAPVALVFFGSRAAFSLPVAGWVLLFTGAGILTSLVIQFLAYLQRGTAPAKRPNYRAPLDPEPEPPRSREVFKSAPASPKTAVSDWEQPGTDDWGEEPREEPSRSTLEEFERRLPNEPGEIEKPQQPQSASQSGSVYSYGYRPSRKAEPPKQETSPPTDNSDRVYDANYRIITPSYRSEPTEETEDEDWV